MPKRGAGSRGAGSVRGRQRSRRLRQTPGTGRQPHTPNECPACHSTHAYAMPIQQTYPGGKAEVVGHSCVCVDCGQGYLAIEGRIATGPLPNPMTRSSAPIREAAPREHAPGDAEPPVGDPLKWRRSAR